MEPELLSKNAIFVFCWNDNISCIDNLLLHKSSMVPSTFCFCFVHGFTENDCPNAECSRRGFKGDFFCFGVIYCLACCCFLDVFSDRFYSRVIVTGSNHHPTRLLPISPTCPDGRSLGPASQFLYSVHGPQLLLLKRGERKYRAHPILARRVL